MPFLKKLKGALRKKSSGSDSPPNSNRSLPVATYGNSPKIHKQFDKNGAEILKFDFVILGGGVAAFFAAAEFIGETFKTSVAIVSRETSPPFCPKEMVQSMAHNQPLSSSFLQSIDWYRKNNVSLLMCTNITEVDTVHRTLRGTYLPDKTPVCFKARKGLILATGARPHPGPPLAVLPEPMEDGGVLESVTEAEDAVGWGLEGVYRLRTFRGAQRLNQALDNSNSVIVVGAGFLGLDMAYIAQTRGKQVTLVCSSPHVLRRVFVPELSDMYQQFFEENGVTMLMNETCSHLLQHNGRVVGIRLASGTVLNADMTFVACGVQPNVELFENQLEMQTVSSYKAVNVDPFMLTSQPGVYAIGDVCAMSYSQHNAGAIRHWNNAKDSAKHITRSILAALHANDENDGDWSNASDDDKLASMLTPDFKLSKPYIPHPSYDLNHFGFHAYMTGDKMSSEYLMFGGKSLKDSSKILAFWLLENRIAGAFVSNPTEEEKTTLDTATREQWYLQNLPDLRELTTAEDALAHVLKRHKL